jgi:hypothetical protein
MLQCCVPCAFAFAYILLFLLHALRAALTVMSLSSWSSCAPTGAHGTAPNVEGAGAAAQAQALFRLVGEVPAQGVDTRVVD